MRRAVAAILFASACGDALPGAPDAPPLPDAGSTALITVRYSTSQSSSELPTSSPSGRRVYFINPSGSLASVTTTDGAGLASARMPEGGTIVVLDDFTISVYVGARGGEEILVGTPPPQRGNLNVLTLKTKLEPYEDVTQYLLHSSCAATDGGVLFSTPIPNVQSVTSAVGDTLREFAFRGCDPDDMQDLLYTAVDDFGIPLAYHYYPSVKFTSNIATRPVDANYTPVRSHVVVNNIASRIPSVGVIQRLWGRYYLTNSTEATFNSDFIPTDGRVDTILSIPTPGEAMLVTQVSEAPGDNLGVQNVVQWGPGNAETTVDFGGGAVAHTLSNPVIDYSSFTVNWNDEPSPPDDPARPDTVFLSTFTSTGQTINILAPYTVDDTGAASVAFPRISPLIVPLQSGSIPVSLVKLHLGTHAARQQLLMTGLDPFPVDGTSGRITYESPRPFEPFPL